MNIIPLFIPHAGCKTRCIFCNEYSATGLPNFPEFEKLYDVAVKYHGYFKDKTNVEIAFYGGTFTGLPIEVMAAYLEFSMRFIREGYAKAIRFSTSPEEITSEKLSLLSRYPISLIEVGVQSFDKDVLKASRRPHDVNDVYNATKLLKSFDMPFGMHLMTGLPYDTEEKDLISAIEVAQLGASTCRIHPAVVLKGTALEEMYLRGEYKPQSLENALEITWKMYVILTSKGIKVNRMGLCLYGDTVKEVVAGPYHPAFGDLAKSKVALEILRLISSKNSSRKLLLPDNAKYRQFFTGYKRYVVDNLQKEGITLEFSKKDSLAVDIDKYIDDLCERVTANMGVFR
ncbi:radical SAM protein [Kosmotoga arenicorallina S304]|uniref:Radical SAM protein n=1 Tax=Kosmotoga arenicorallina S304 TaxID=1453497 RepID=A0A176K1Y4_9BACT|nr:radical SAM protein [Kosmotoga arenicorallina]OAA31184.1 radical SAM protein [Kosmotoga arenicorallina S304]